MASYSVALISLVVFLANPKWIAWCLMAYVTLEVGLHWGIAALRRRFQWLITAADQLPKFPDALLTKFLADGFDPELGWSRKPNTTKQEIGKYGPTRYHINEHGQRMNPGHEDLPIQISTYGDSFTFCRQVNDHEAFQWHLSQLTQTNVLNYGVGNYGLDQAFLRMQREFPKQRSQIVILGVVPSTVVRIESVWKHYNEFGNTLAFKPRFIMQGETLKLIPNFINTAEKLKNYRPYLKEINQYDSFYESKFLAEMLAFPYCYSLLKAPKRHLSLLYKVLFGQQQQALDAIMASNLSLRQRLFKEADSLQLLNSLLDSFISYAKQQEFTPILMWMPQKDDILCIRSQGPYYQDFIQAAKQRMNVIDLTESLLKVDNIEDLYSDDSHYGGHLSKEGNKRIAHEIYQYLLSVNLLAPKDRHCVNVTEKDAQTI
ncbi:hypothetical protein [Candidatus Berkiella aquae]|uniref:Uncharacterized protein n=1 Tax=Candidatus Berkiella aquae TaxID=295108 RepID=A0AAE3L9V5_9GAMM|nr:hypothetical protein [Candidatus Berkiella aquae]MCS5712320.1 hypothetical protein [Candidatus Berkiella aquae]